MAEYIKKKDLLKVLPPKCNMGDMYATAYNTCLNTIENLIKEHPTADVVEIKYGKWRLETDEEMPDFMFKLVVCSVCGSKSNQMYRYCPCCGAKMKLEGDSNEQTTRYSG